MASFPRVLVVAAAIWIATTACGAPEGDNDRTAAVTESTLDGSSPTSLPEHGDTPLTVEGDVVEVVDRAALVLGGAETDEVLVIVRRSTDVRPGARVEVTGVAQVLDVDELERQLARTFDDKLRSFEGERVIVADAVTVQTEAGDAGR